MHVRHFIVLFALLAASPAPAEEPDLKGRPVAEWIKDLDDKQSLVREEAIEVLIQAKAKEALPKLTKLLDDANASVRRRAALALWKIDGQTKPAQTALLAVLRDPKAAQHREALNLLREVAPPDDEYIPLLIGLLEDRDVGVMAQANNLLVFKGDKAVPAVVAALPKADAAGRERLIAFLGRLAVTQRDKVEPALRELLNKSDDRTRLAAARALTSGGRNVDVVAPVLAPLAAANDARVRQDALGMAINLQPARADLVPVYRQALKEGDAAVRVRAVEKLYEVDRASLKETMPVLIATIKEGGAARVGALSVLQRLGLDAKPALEAVAELLATGDEATVSDLRVFLPQLNRLGPDALPLMTKLLKHPNAAVRNSAATALRDMGAPALPHLLPLLKDPDPEARRPAFYALSHAGPAAVKALPQIIDGLKDGDFLVRQYALTALLGVGPGAKEAVGPLMEVLIDETQPERNRALAARALGRIGPDAKAAVPELRRLTTLTDARPRGDPRVAYAQALWMIDGDRKDALPVLLDYLKTNRTALSPRPDVGLDFLDANLPPGDVMDALKPWLKKDITSRRQVVMLVSSYYPEAKEAIPLLGELLKDRDATVSRQAAALLARHGAAGKAAVPVLAAAVRDWSFPDVGTLDALARLGPNAAEALPALLDRWKNSRALQERPRLAATILAIDADKGKEQLEYLRTEVKTGTIAYVRLPAAVALAEVEPKNPHVLAALQEYARDPNRATAGDALVGLGVLKSAAKDALPAIRAHLNGGDVYLRLRAADALWRVEGKPDAVIPVLTALLAERSEQSPLLPVGRFALATKAAQALGEIGLPAAAALPDLRKCLGEPDESLRRAAAVAIKRIAK